MKSRFLCAVVALSIGGSAFVAAPAVAAPAPAWQMHSIALPTNFAPGSSGVDAYEVTFENIGGESMNGQPLTLTDTLPAGLTVSSLNFPLPSGFGTENEAETFCETTNNGGIVTATCTVPAELASKVGDRKRKPALLGPSEHLRLVIGVAVPPSAQGTLVNFARIQGGGAPAAQTSSQNVVSAVPAGPGFEAFEATLNNDAGGSLLQAGAHPFQYSTYFALHSEPAPLGSNSRLIPAGGDVKDIEVQLPPGLIGNPTAAARCPLQQFDTSETIIPAEGAPYIINECPDASAIGVVIVQQLEGEGQALGSTLYNLMPPPGEPALLGFRVSGAYFYIDTSVRTGADYGITATLRNLSEIKRVNAAAVTIWGTPASHSHDSLRGTCMYPFAEYRPFNSLGPCSAGVSTRPFLRLPTSCSTPMSQTMRFDTWNNQGIFQSLTSPSPSARNCAPLSFSPTVTTSPQVTTADSPAGLRFNLHLPQSEDPEALATADLRDIAVSLPPGLSVNPSSASGLAGCTSGQVELHGPNAPACPEASKVGSVEVRTPLLDHPIKGSVYVATQGDNPFGSLVTIYVTAYDPETGVVLKLAGNVELDRQTGQITTRFMENPQLPFEDLSVELFPGSRASLRTPPACGIYGTTTTMTPWSAPESGPPTTKLNSFPISTGPGSGACPDGGTAIALSAGIQTPLGGSYSPFVMRLTREDGTGEISSVSLDPPKGLLARLAGIPYCDAAGIAKAQSRNHLGGGGEELSSPSCSSASRVGTITAGAGAGPTPFYAGGQVYLAGPYKGAPLSLVAIVPAVAGPFDLGVVTDRVALNVDPETTQVSAVSDPFPTILSGIPLDIKDIRINLDRPDFTLAPTSCAPTAVRATADGAGGEASASDRFQVGGCKGLDFKPKLRISLKGSTKHAGHPALKAVLTYPKGGMYANIARAQVNLPHSEFLDQSNLNKTCTRPVLLAGNCPAKSIYGKAKAWSPLLENPLEGPVYLVGGFGYKLPALVAELKGQIRVILKGKVDSGPNKGIRNTFEAVPDAPVSRFVLEMKGGKKYSLLENSENLCSKPQRAIVRFTGQNGAVDHYKPLIANQCGKKAHRKKKSSSS